MSLATVLKQQLGYRTAFFQSAKGNFEARPGLVHNLGFEKFYTRDDLGDPNSFVGYLACDEFALLEAVSNWIRADEAPFLLAYLCSVTHDHYEVPEWFAEPARDALVRYRQTIAYTDTFLAALDAQLCELGVADDTIMCVISDHGEAFGEHGLHGHERIAFDEVLRVPFCIRAPYLTDAGRRIGIPVSSVDVTPTVLGLLGFDSSTGRFDGSDLLGACPVDRKVHFGGWIPDGPGGYVTGGWKFIYNPSNETVLSYNLVEDPGETVAIPLEEAVAGGVMREVSEWRSNSIFKIQQSKTGKAVLFDRWRCWWNNRVADVKYEPDARH
jgi:phosphoglycerol transferase MdoB-like AlkP superfamily enzyme